MAALHTRHKPLETTLNIARVTEYSCCVLVEFVGEDIKHLIDVQTQRFRHVSTSVADDIKHFPSVRSQTLCYALEITGDDVKDRIDVCMHLL